MIRERTSMLRHTYIACLVFSSVLQFFFCRFHSISVSVTIFILILLLSEGQAGKSLGTLKVVLLRMSGSIERKSASMLLSFVKTLRAMTAG
jgi:hypothetical protein